MIVNDPLRHFLQYWNLTICVVGLASNSLLFVVFNGRFLKKNSVAIYFRSIAISNIAMNCVFFKNFYIYTANKDFSDSSVFLCKSSMFITYMLSSLPAWFLVAAGLNRFITIVFPMKLSLLKKENFSRFLILFIVIFSIAYYTPLIFDANLITISIRLTLNITNKSDLSSSIQTFIYCGYTKNHKSLLLLDFVNTTVVPFIVMLSSTLATLIGVYLVHKRAKKHLSKSKTYQMRDIKFAITMIVLNVIFLCFKIPNFMIFIGNFFEFMNTMNENQLRIVKCVYDILNSLFYTIDFPLQLLTNSLVRKQFLMLFQRNAKLVKFKSFGTDLL